MRMVQGPTRRMSARITGSLLLRWRWAAGVTSSPQSVQRQGLLHALELAQTHLLERQVAVETRTGLAGQHDLAALRLGGEARRDVGGHAGRSIGPARAGAPLDLGRPQEGGPRVHADVHAQRIEAVRELRPDLRGAAVNGPRSVHRGPGMVALVEDHHEPVARRLVHVATVLDDLVEECPEVALHESVEIVGREARREPRIAADVGKKHAHIRLALVEAGRLRRFLYEVAHPLRHELGEAPADEEAALELARIVEDLLMR